MSYTHLFTIVLLLKFTYCILFYFYFKNRISMYFNTLFSIIIAICFIILSSVFKDELIFYFSFRYLFVFFVYIAVINGKIENAEQTNYSIEFIRAIIIYCLCYFLDILSKTYFNIDISYPFFPYIAIIIIFSEIATITITKKMYYFTYSILTFVAIFFIMIYQSLTNTESFKIRCSCYILSTIGLIFFSLGMQIHHKLIEKEKREKDARNIKKL